MADRRARIATIPDTSALIASGVLTASAPFSEMTAAQTAQTQYMNIGWQQTAWLYYMTIGPLNYGINWLSNAVGRVALTIAEVMPGSEEPEILESGPAVDILHQLKWDESAILADLALQLSVPGRGYLVGFDIAPGIQEWKVYSPNQIRPAATGRGWDWELWEYGKQWIPLNDALVVVVRDADDRFDWMDTSTVRGALTILREIDLYDRAIVSSLVSRMASNGLLLIPQEVTFPTRQQFNDGEDPFTLDLIEAARQGIKDPGSASAAIPIPLRVPSQFIDKFKHLPLSNVVDEKIIDNREKALGIMADTINLPKEVVLGMGDVNHSSGLAQDLEESAIKNHICPVMEVICQDLTRGFLYPQLIAAREKITGPNGGRLVVWYDTTALAAKPDKSADAIQLYDRAELSGEALRREAGFTEEDAPDAKELRTQLLIKAASIAQYTLTAIEELTGSSVGSDNKTSVQEQDSAAIKDEVAQDVESANADPSTDQTVPKQSRRLESVS